MMKDSLNNYNVAFIAEQEAEFRRIYGILDLTSKDCDYLWECNIEAQRLAYLKKHYSSHLDSDPNDSQNNNPNQNHNPH